MKFEARVVDGRSVVDLHHASGTVTECLMSPMEPLVYDVLCDMLPPAGAAAEIGSFRGGSAAVFLHGTARRGKDWTLFAHDLFQPFRLGGRAVDIEAHFDQSTREWRDRLVKVRGDSKATHAVHRDRSLGYVFVDGDHTYPGALADLRNFLPKLRADGWLVVQDSIGEVERALRDFLPGSSLVAARVDPPVGHFVTVCHRDAEALDAFAENLRARLRAAGPGPLHHL